MKEYKKPSVTSDIIIFTKVLDKLNVLLIKRKNPPYQGFYGFPGGFLEENETIWQCALRELKEETDVTVYSLKELGVFSDPNRDERGWVISDCFMTFVDYKDLKFKAQDDAQDAKLFEVTYYKENNYLKINLKHDDIILENTIDDNDNIIESNLCFDHLKMLKRALESL